MNWLRRINIILCLPLLACNTIEAPEDFDALTSYLYKNLPTEDPAVLQVGMENMLVWLNENHDTLEEGYSVNGLTLEAIQTVHPDLEELSLMGAALSMDIRHDIDMVSQLLFLEGYNDDPPEPDANSWHIRRYNEDPECFVSKECDMLSWNSNIRTIMPLNIAIETLLAGHVRWVETSAGPALVQRRWFTSDPVVSVNWAQLKAEYALKMSFPLAEGGSRRVEINWVDIRIGDIPVSEDIALLLGLNAIRDNINGLNNKEPEL